MNEDKVVAVLVRIEQEKAAFVAGSDKAVGFNMGTWFSDNATSEGTEWCGTVACFAGHAAIMEGYEPINNSDCVRNIATNDVLDVEDVAKDVLDLDTGSVFYLDSLDEVYIWFADRMGIDEVVLRDKVRGLM